MRMVLSCCVMKLPRDRHRSNKHNWQATNHPGKYVPVDCYESQSCAWEILTHTDYCIIVSVTREENLVKGLPVRAGPHWE